MLICIKALSLCKNSKKFTISGYTIHNRNGSNDLFGFRGTKIPRDLYLDTMNIKFYQRVDQWEFHDRRYDTQLEYERNGRTFYTITTEVSVYNHDTEVYIRRNKKLA